MPYGMKRNKMNKPGKNKKMMYTIPNSNQAVIMPNYGMDKGKDMNAKVIVGKDLRQKKGR